MNAVSETNDKIKKGDVQEFSKSEFIIKFSNLIYEKNGKRLMIPIFQGNSGDISYKEFLDYCYKNNLLEKGWGETYFVIKSDKGKLNKTFHEFLNFYKGNILKNVDINKPAKIKVDGGAIDIYYDFEVDSIPFTLNVNISTGKKDIDSRLIKSIFDISLNENGENPIFRYIFWKNKKSNNL